MSRPSPDRARLLLQAALALLVLAAYAGVAGNGFINLDDNDYVTQNPRVQTGITWSGVVWAFTTGHSANWHPLTWLSHMLDCQIAGTTPLLPHLENLGLHLASTLLLFRLLERATGQIAASAFVAAVFGLHPLHVESVAWVAERKDVLSTLIGVLAIGAYVGWTKERSGGRFAVVVLLYALGLLAKPMLVTLPFLLLLLDLWPLRRDPSARLVLEKLPLFALAAASSATTFLVQRAAGAMSLGERVPFGLRVQNALVSVAAYLRKTIWPADLAVYYPHPATAYPGGRVALAALVLAGASALALAARRAHPWLLVGWLWFLGMLVPVIGLVQVGSQAMADRYTYLPIAGLAIAVGFEAADVARRKPAARGALAAAGAAAVLAWAYSTWIQVGFWRNDRTLFGHAVDVMPGNHVAHGILGNVLLRERRLGEAMTEYDEALRIRPDYAQAHSNAGMVLELGGRTDEAIEKYRTALRWSPDLPEAHLNLGQLLASHGRLAEGIAELEAALRSNPDLVEAHFNLGVALLAARRNSEAVAEFRKALELRPGYAEARRMIEKAGRPG